MSSITKWMSKGGLSLPASVQPRNVLKNSKNWKSKAQVNKADRVTEIMKSQTYEIITTSWITPHSQSISYDTFYFPTSIALHFCGIYAKIRATWGPSPKPKETMNTETSRRSLVSAIRVLAGNDLTIKNELSLHHAYLPTVMFKFLKA